MRLPHLHLFPQWQKKSRVDEKSALVVFRVDDVLPGPIQSQSRSPRISLGIASPLLIPGREKYRPQWRAAASGGTENRLYEHFGSRVESARQSIHYSSSS